VRHPATAIRQSIRDRARPRKARAPCTSSFLKPTRSSAISTASRSLDAPSNVFAASRSWGSSQNALRTLPLRVARTPEIVSRVRPDRGLLGERFRRVGGDIDTCPSRCTQHHNVSYAHELSSSDQIVVQGVGELTERREEFRAVETLVERRRSGQGTEGSLGRSYLADGRCPSFGREQTGWPQSSLRQLLERRRRE
jgi:hypothetical protein